MMVSSIGGCDKHGSLAFRHFKQEKFRWSQELSAADR